MSEQPAHYTVTVHYGSNGMAECGAEDHQVPPERLTKRPEDVTCATCRGYLPLVAPAHKHEAPSTFPAEAFGQVLRLQKAYQAAADTIAALQNVQQHLYGALVLLQRDEAQCPNFPGFIQIIEDELNEIADVRARAVSRLNLANEGCPQIKREDPKGNGVAS
jgi:hypothetical protein